MNKTKRITYFDVLKVISILCVIYLHYPWISNSKGSNITMILSVIAVPLFLMVNGALVLGKNINIHEHYKKTLKYFMMIIIWKIITILLFSVSKQINIIDYNWYEIILSILSNYNLNGIPTEHLWFLYALIKIYMIVPFLNTFIKKYKNGTKYIIFVLFIMTFGFELIQFIFLAISKLFQTEYFNFSNLNDSYKILTDGRVTLYFILGYYLHNKWYNIRLSNYKKIKYCIWFTVGIMCLFFARYIQTGNVFNGYYVRINNDYHKIGTLVMSISVFILAATSNFKGNKVIAFIGKNTLNIYLIHMIICKLLGRYLYPVLNVHGAKGNIIKTIIVLLLSIAITELLKKIKPIKKMLNLS